METPDTATFFGIYLNDHLAAAAAGAARARSFAHAYLGGADRERLRRLADDIAADRGALLSIMKSQGVPVRRYKSLLVAAVELAGRLKLNGRVRGRSPLSDLVEVEVLRLGVEGKASLWRTLRDVAAHEPGLDADELQRLYERAQSQSALLEELRREAAERVFLGPGAARRPTPAPQGAR